ncbi:hypothetical protein F5Y16DRAFT_295133 [Xylariaceae sp. FL0255]|nr:hypothetical protein F5Y16DRAFT_295133 [Xylariaceae sp. FL0255]
MAPSQPKQQKQHATEFQKIINAGRERKADEQLAARIFGKSDQRRASAPIKPGGSLASRVGVKKQQRLSSSGRIPTGNINGEWTHDLHNPRDNKRQPAPNSLAARVHAPGTALPKTRPNNRAAKLANAFNRTAQSSSPAAQQQMNVRQSPQQGIAIKGLAGPFIVLAQNFAPGTTAADIESAMTPVGGVVSSCRVVKTHPIVIAEVVFDSKDSADRVIETFDKQNADGRTLSVYMKPGGYTVPPTGPRAQRTNETTLGNNSVLVDGSHGFNDPMETDGSQGRLYSDNLTNGQGHRNKDNRSSRRGR